MSMRTSARCTPSSRDASSRGPVAAIWATGDLVGYGAEPAEVLALLQEHHLVAVAGNHDLAACGKLGVDEFNASAAAAARVDGGEPERRASRVARRIAADTRRGRLHPGARQPA